MKKKEEMVSCVIIIQQQQIERLALSCSAQELVLAVGRDIVPSQILFLMEGQVKLNLGRLLKLFGAGFTECQSADVYLYQM